MFQSNTLRRVFTVLCVIGFAVIAYFITQGSTLAFDTTVQNAVFSLRSQWLTAVLTLLTYSGNWQVVTLLCIALLILPQTRKHYGMPLTLSALLSVAFYEALKFIFQRPRPDIALRLIQEGGFSFPSGHTLTSLVFWGTAILLIRSYSHLPHSHFEEKYDFPHITKKSALNFVTALLFLYILLMGFSRVYVGVHYPTDVLGSWFLGCFMLTALRSTALSPFLSARK